MLETRVWSLCQEDPLEKKWQPTPVLSPGKSHGQRSLVGYSPWGRRELDTNEWLYLLMHLVKPSKASFFIGIQLSSVAQLCLTLCNPMDYSMPVLPVHHQLPEPTQTHVHCVGDAIQPSHPLLSLSPPAFNLSQHQGLCQWVSSSHQVTEVLEFQCQHQPFQWICRN